MDNIKTFSEFKYTKAPYMSEILEVFDNSDKFVWCGRRKPNIDILRFQEIMIDILYKMYVFPDFENLTEYNGFLTEV